MSYSKTAKVTLTITTTIITREKSDDVDDDGNDASTTLNRRYFDVIFLSLKFVEDDSNFHLFEEIQFEMKSNGFFNQERLAEGEGSIPLNSSC